MPLSCWLGVTVLACTAPAHAEDGRQSARWQDGAEGIGFLPDSDVPGFDAHAWGPTPGVKRSGRTNALADPQDDPHLPRLRKFSAEKITLGEAKRDGTPRTSRSSGRSGIGFSDVPTPDDACDPASCATDDETPVRPPAASSPHFIAGVKYDRMPYELHPVDPDMLSDLPTAEGPTWEEQLTGDDRNMIGLGWHFIMPTGRSTPITTKTSALGLGSFSNPGSSVSLGNMNTVALTITHFFTEHIASEIGAGFPPMLTLRGSGSIGLPLGQIFPGIQGKLPLINLANPNSNPLGTSRALLVSTVMKYYLGGREDKIRPFVGLGISYARFTNTNLNSVFQGKLASLGGLLSAGNALGNLQSLLQNPDAIDSLLQAGANLVLPSHTTVSAQIKSTWTPVFMLGTSYQLTRRLWLTGMVTYIPLRTTITLNINQPGKVLASNTTKISANPLLGSLLLDYRF